MFPAAVLFERYLAAFVVLLALVYPRLGRRPLARLYAAIGRFARRRRRAVLVTAIAPLAFRALLLPVLPVPEPAIADEFSHLLVADTLRHGRLTNPTHAFWPHFETFHVIHHPTYASQYQPGLGMVMAAGWLLFGSPWAGIVLSAALMCGAITWMLQAWVPARWAFIGGILAGFRLATFSYWMNSYWGGALTAAGAALLLGGFGHLRRRRRARDAVCIGCGAVILASTRPYEGLLVCAPVYLFLLWDTLGLPGRRQFELAPKQIAVIAAILFGGAAFILQYNAAVTGDPLKLPYLAANEQYGTVQALPMLRTREHGEIRNEEMRKFQAGQTRLAAEASEEGQWVDRAVKTYLILLYGLCGPLLSIPLLLAWPWVSRRRRLRSLVVVGLVFVAGVSLELFFAPHYGAPAAPLAYVFAAEGLRTLQTCRCFGRPGGLFLARAIPVACVVSFAFSAIGSPILSKPSFFNPVAMWYCCNDPGNLRRAEVLSELENRGGRHLVFARYGPHHRTLSEWVYNEADIDAARVVWARELDPSSNAKLIEYFSDRQAWLVEPDEKNVEIQPYMPAEER